MAGYGGEKSNGLTPLLVPRIIVMAAAASGKYARATRILAYKYKQS